ncbi:MAG TPA: YjbH domain-containing protein, partial [Rhabdochlamydiaceae bacterium]
MKRLLILCFILTVTLGARESLFEDLATVEKINKQINDELPFYYNYSLIGGYFNMPSARMPKEGMYAIGGGTVPPYNFYGMNYQLFDCMELSGNYLSFKGIPAENGMGDQADRIGNIKIGATIPQTRTNFAVGADDFFNTGHFNSQYVVITQQWLAANLEMTLGLGKGRMRGFYGGVSWSPLRNTDLFFLKDVSLIAEYDNNAYKKHDGEHPFGKDQKIPINAGISYIAGDALQLSVSSVRGQKVAASASLKFPLGTTQGFFKKTEDPQKYQSPVDAEPLGVYRKDKAFAEELAYALDTQGLDLYTVYLTPNNHLWLKIINNRYREEKVVRERLQYLLAALTPSNVEVVNVVMEADGIPSQGYTFRREDLERFRLRAIGDFELATLSPLTEATHHPCDSDLLFHRSKEIWSFTLKPRILTFFGGAEGKFKYSVGITAAPEGYLFNEVYYKLQAGYAAYSSMANLNS